MYNFLFFVFVFNLKHQPNSQLPNKNIMECRRMIYIIDCYFIYLINNIFHVHEIYSFHSTQIISSHLLISYYLD